MKFLLLVGTYMEAQNQKKNLTYLAWTANYRPKSRKSRFLEMQLLGILTSRNFAGLSILTSEMIPENFRSIFQPIKSELGHVTLPNLRGDVMSSIPIHLPGFKSFWIVELKLAFYKSQTRALIVQEVSKILSALYWFYALVTAIKIPLFHVKVHRLD